MTQDPFDRDALDPKFLLDKLEAAMWFVGTVARAIGEFDQVSTPDRSSRTLQVRIQESVDGGLGAILRHQLGADPLQLAHQVRNLHQDFQEKVDSFRRLA